MKSYNIQTAEDVRNFILDLKNEYDLAFHPDTDFRDYVNTNTGGNSFTEFQSMYYNDVLTSCFKMCARRGLDIYEIGISVMYPHMC